MALNSIITALAYIILASVIPTQAQTAPPSCGNKVHGVIRNIIASIDPATLCVPSQTGQYKLSMNAVVQSHDVLSHATVTASFNWYDGAGNETRVMPSIMGSAAPPNASVDATFNFVTATQTPITYSVTKDGTDLSAVAIYWTIELLQPLKTF